MWRLKKAWSPCGFPPPNKPHGFTRINQRPLIYGSRFCVTFIRIHPFSSARVGAGGGAKASGTGLDWVGENEARFTRPGYRTARPGRVRTERAWLSQCSPSGEERVGAAGPVMWSSRPFLPSILEGNEKKVIFKVKFDKWWNIIIN